MSVPCNLEMRRNTSYYKTFKIRSEVTKKPLDITGWKFVAGAKIKLSDSVLAFTISIKIIDGPKGLVSLYIACSDLPSGSSLIWDSKIQPPDRGDWLPLKHGTIRITEGVYDA